MKQQRRTTIMELLEEKGTVYLSELSRLFPEVSVMTLRRDLDYFEEKGTAVRIHGGAQKKKAGIEPLYSFRETRNRAQKEHIARLCLSYIEEGSSIFVDCGTTAMEIAKIFPDKRLSVVTSGPNVGMEISRRKDADVTILGGQLNSENFSVSGKLTENMLDNINIDVAVVAASGCSLSGAFSCGSYNESELKRKVLARAQTKIVVADESKFNKSLMFTFASYEDVDIFITSSRPPEEIEEKLLSHDKKIIY